jgi:D-alanine-D-alanine ligase
MIDINVVLIADRIEKKENMDSYDLEKISDEYFKQIHGALERVCKNVIHYNSLVDFIDNIEKHKHDLVFSIYGGEKSRNRLALVPAICEAYDIKFIGPDAYDRIICQDKDISKELAKKLKLKTPKSITVLPNEKITNHIFNNLNFPVVVKPLYEGSSIGINEHSFCKDITSTLKRLTQTGNIS